MAKTQVSAPVSNQSDKTAPQAGTPAAIVELTIAQVAEAQAKARNEVLTSQTFGEAFKACYRSARWHDVLSAAERFALPCEEASKSVSDGKPGAIARKAAAVQPALAMEFRFALASYSLSGRSANATQLAELASKLPFLATKGGLKDKSVTFGGIILPPIAGEL